jgi:hypothetical protein
MLTTRVVNRHKEPYDVYIGRPTIYGNPFHIGTDGTREEVVAKYKEYAKQRLDDKALQFLVGKTLGCSCKPKPCHGDVLIELLVERGFVVLSYK